MGTILDIVDRTDTIKIHWYQRILYRMGVWRHLLSPIYIFVVLFLSVLLLPSVFLPVTWFPWTMYVTHDSEDLCKH